MGATVNGGSPKIALLTKRAIIPFGPTAHPFSMSKMEAALRFSESVGFQMAAETLLTLTSSPFGPMATHSASFTHATEERNPPGCGSESCQVLPSSCEYAATAEARLAS